MYWCSSFKEISLSLYILLVYCDGVVDYSSRKEAVNWIHFTSQRGEIRGQSLEISILDAQDKNLICDNCCWLPSDVRFCLQPTNILIECRKNNIVAENFCLTIVKTDLKRILNSLEVKINRVKSNSRLQRC